MAATKPFNALDTFKFQTVDDLNKSEMQATMDQIKEKSVQNVTPIKKEEKSNGRSGYHITIRFPEEYKLKLKILALQEFDDNITTYINKLVEDDFKRRGI